MKLYKVLNKLRTSSNSNSSYKYFIKKFKIEYSSSEYDGFVEHLANKDCDYEILNKKLSEINKPKSGSRRFESK